MFSVDCNLTGYFAPRFIVGHPPVYDGMPVGTVSLVCIGVDLLRLAPLAPGLVFNKPMSNSLSWSRGAENAQKTRACTTN